MNTITINVVAQIISIFAIFFFVSSIQNKKKSKIMLFQVIANFLYALSYLFLNAYTATLMDSISGIRCLIYYKFDKKRKSIPKFIPFIFIMIVIIFGIITYNTYLSIIPIIITIAYILSSMGKNVRMLRIVYLLCGVLWFYYNYKVGAYVCLIGNVFEITSAVVALLRFKKIK